MACYEITYTGKGISLNDVRAGNWQNSHSHIKRLKNVFSWLIIEAHMKFLPKYKVSLTYNARYDCDNTIYIAKCLVDSLKMQGKIKDDTKKYYRGFTVTPDETLPPNTYKFLISEVN
jgi:hypothetical protein